MSIRFGFKPFLRAALAKSLASFSQLPDSLAYRIVSGSAGRAGAAGWAA